MSWQWKMIKKLKRNWLVVLKLTWGTPQILTRALKSLKKLCFSWLLVTKVYIFELQKYRGVIFYDTEAIYKFWRKTDLWFKKRLEKFGKFPPPIGQEEIYLETQLKRVYWFILKISRVLFVPTGRVGIGWWTLL